MWLLCEYKSSFIVHFCKVAYIAWNTILSISTIQHFIIAWSWSENSLYPWNWVSAEKSKVLFLHHVKFFILVFFRFTWCNSICIGYSRHRIPTQTNDVYNSTAYCVFHSLGIWWGHNTNAYVASDQVSTLFTTLTIKIECNHYGSLCSYSFLRLTYMLFSRVLQAQKKYLGTW